MKKRFFFLLAAAMLALSSNAQTVISVAEAITTGSALPKNGYTTTECIVLGYVVSVVDYSPALGYQTFYLADDQANSLGQTFQAYQCTIDNYGEKAKVLVGDQVTVTGKIKNHNGTLIEIPSGKTEFQTMVEGDHTVPTSFKSINVSKALTDGAALASNGYSEEAYWVVGYVSNIQEDKFSSDGWQTFWIADDASSTAKTNADGAFEVYRGKPSDAVKVGDRVRVLTRLYYYKGTTVETETYVTVESAEVNVDFTDVYWAYDPKADEWYLNGNSSAYALGLYTAPGKIKNFTSLLGMFSTADFDLEKSSIYAFGSQHKILSIEAILSPVSMDPLIIEANMTIMGDDLVRYTVHMIKNYPTGVYGGRTVASKTMKIYDYTEEYGFYILYGSTPDGYDISCYVYGSDFTGTWTINKNAQAYVSYSGENPVACDGSFTVTKDDKVVKLTGSFTCFDEYSYSVTMEKNISGTPWVENLQDAGYDLTNNVVLCVKFTDDAVACNSIYFIGTFTSWNLDMTYQFTELPQFPGWYVCSVVYDAGFQGKPIHVDYKGNLTWKFQPGDVKAWKHVGGYDASIFDNGYDGESNAEFASAGAYIYEISYWKKHKNPCVPVPTHKYTINVYPPVCETMEYDLALVGEFNDWNGVAMEKMVDKDNKTYYSYVLNAEEEQEYLFCESNEALWQNRIMVYDADVMLFNPMSNYSLPETKEENPVITLDLSDPAKYQWEKCFSTAPECYLGLSMTDMYSDGWNNGYLTVSDGSYNGIYTLRTGGYKQVKIPYFGNEMNFSWTTGSWPEEVGFTILASNGVPLFNHEQNTSLYDGLVYTLKSSPCSSSANPFAPKNIIAKLNEYRQMAIVWDAVDGAASYSITVTTPTNEFLVNNMAINELTYTTGALVDDGEYKITLVAFDKNNVQLGATTTKVNIVLPKVEQAEITIMAPSDCGLDVTNGIWMSWRKTGETGWPNVVKMSTEDNIFFTTTIKPNAVTYDYMFTNGDPDVEGTRFSYYYWTNSTQTKLCREISYSGGDKWIYVDWADCDKMANHDYRPYNLKAVPTPGRVDFSWEQKDASKQFMIQIYDAVTESVIDGFYCSDTKSYSWGIPASLVGNQVYWGLTVYDPYSLPEVIVSDKFTLEAGPATLKNAKAETTDNKTIDMTWEFDPSTTSCMVEIYYSGNIVKREIVSGNSFHYTGLAKGTHECYVQPVDKDNKPVGGKEFVNSVDLTDVPAGLTDLAGKADGRHIIFTWKKTAPQVEAYLYRSTTEGWIMETYLTTDKEKLEFDVTNDGLYILEIYTMAEYEPGKYSFLGDYATTSVTAFLGKTYHVEIKATTGGLVWPTGLNGEFAEGYSIYFNTYTDYTTPGYVFKQWSDGITDYSRTITITQDTVLIAIYEPLYQLTLTSSTGGTVSLDGIYYDYDGVSVYKAIKGSEFTLSAQPETGYKFVEWSDGVKTLSRTITLDADMTLSASFTEAGSTPQYTVLIQPDSYLAGDVSSVNSTYYEGSVFDVTAIPNPGYKFVKWSDEKTDNPRTITVNSDITLVAMFAEMKYKATILAGEGGTVEPAGEVKDLSYGANLSIKATPKTGYEFYNWSDGSPLAERVIYITQDTVLKANFKEPYVPVYFTLAISAGEGGTVNEEVNKTYESGTKVLIKATPDKGYLFDKWSDENTEAERIVLIDKDVTLKALFKVDVPTPSTFTLKISAGEGGTVNTEVNKTYDAGTKVEIIATPNEGYEFVKWSDGNTEAKRTITMDKDYTLNAVFKEKGAPDPEPVKYDFAVSSAGGGTVTSDKENGKYDEGTVINIEAKPDKDWTFDKWSDGVTLATRAITLSKDTNLIAYFKTSKKYKVTVSGGEGGKVSPKMSDEEVAGGTILELKATPDDDYKFIKWSDGNTEAERKVVITQDTILKATFEEIIYRTLTVEIYPADCGIVYFDGKEIGSMKKKVEQGTSIKLTAEPVSGYEFRYYEEDGQEDVTDAEYIVKMTKNRAITAVFKKKPQDIDNVNVEGQVLKIYRDGQIFIIRGDKTYTTQGQLVK